jgi:hypothetical protein
MSPPPATPSSPASPAYARGASGIASLPSAAQIIAACTAAKAGVHGSTSATSASGGGAGASGSGADSDDESGTHATIGPGADSVAGSAADYTGLVLAFWGDARWSRAQLLGEIARGHWGLAKAGVGDLVSRHAS